jgi:hypothetical protein
MRRIPRYTRTEMSMEAHGRSVFLSLWLCLPHPLRGGQASPFSAEVPTGERPGQTVNRAGRSEVVGGFTIKIPSLLSSTCDGIGLGRRWTVIGDLFAFEPVWSRCLDSTIASKSVSRASRSIVQWPRSAQCTCARIGRDTGSFHRARPAISPLELVDASPDARPLPR